MRVTATFQSADVVTDELCQQAAIDGLISLLGRPEVKRHSPAAWLLGVRYLLNLSKHPNSSVSRTVLSRWKTLSGDPELTAYLDGDECFGLLTHYEPRSASRVGSIMAGF